MLRTYTTVILEHFKVNRQMIFLVGPRQVGKTTIAKMLQDSYTKSTYLNWDNQEHRSILLAAPKTIAEHIGVQQLSKTRPLVIFDELHKHSRWKGFLKGFFDTYKDDVDIIVTGSAKLDLKKKSADSLMGRYFSYHIFPLSVAEINNTLPVKPFSQPKNLADKKWQNLFRFGGFPEPYLKANNRFSNQWQRLRQNLLVREDISNLTQIQEIDKLEILAQLIANQAGGLTNYSSFANRLQVSVDTIRRWVVTLRAFYYCFQVLPYTKNITRTLLKEPKLYLWDWHRIEDEGAKIENFIAVHLLKAVTFWTDHGFGEYSLHYLRNKEKKEVDFVITQNKKAYILIEVKKSETQLSKNLFYFQNMSGAQYAFQVVFDLPYVDADCFKKHSPIIVPAKTLLSQLCI